MRTILFISLLAGSMAFDSAGRVSAQVMSPGWSRTGSLNTGRSGYTATLLSNGNVLVAGGINCAVDFLRSTELYDPTSETWSYTGSLNVARRDHSATLLHDGRVLIAGGEIGSYQYAVQAEIYEPTSGTWSTTGPLSSIRVGHTATLLANGKVLVVGGAPQTGNAELYDPATGTWSPTGSLNNDIVGGNHATRLPDGKVLFLGITDYRNSTAIAELYDPRTGSWSVTASPGAIQIPHAITSLPNSKVLVIGSGSAQTRIYAEIYAPASATWSSTDAGIGGISVVLPNGKVLAAGDTSSALYDPVSGRWSSSTGSNIPIASSHATLLSNGQVLFPNSLSVASRGNVCAPHNTDAALFDYRLAPSGSISNVSAASYSLLGLASEVITAAFGTGLSTTSSAASTLPLPTQLAGTSVSIKDSAGSERLAPLFYVSPTQVNYQIPPGTAQGAASVIISSGDGTVSNGVAIIHAIAPGLFTANSSGEGVAAALALRVKSDGTQSYEQVAEFDAQQNRFVARPLDLGPADEQVYLVLFGTGIRHRSSLAAVNAFTRATDAIRGVSLEVTYAGAQSDFVGLDQINLLVPRSLAGRGEVEILLTVETQFTNPVKVNIK